MILPCASCITGIPFLRSRYLIHWNPLRGIRGSRNKHPVVAFIQSLPEVTEDGIPVEVADENRLALRKMKLPSILPTNVDKEVDTSRWTHAALKGSEYNIIKTKYPGFFPRVHQRTFPPYVHDRSLEAAEVNKHLFELLKNEKTSIVWPATREEKRARRRLPVPVSLTGFGLDDGKSARYWSSRIRKIWSKIESGIQELDTDDLLQKMPPSVKAVIEDERESLPDSVKELKDWYDDVKAAKELAMKKEVESIPSELQFPYKVALEFRSRLKEELEDLKAEMVVTQNEPQTETSPQLLEKEKEEYMKHHKMLGSIASVLREGVIKSSVTRDEMDAELEGWREEFWRRSYGSSNPAISPSHIPCGGCGANLHCTDPSIPGYLPSELFIPMSQDDLKRQQCQRCEYLHHFDVSVDVNVDPDLYPEILSKIRENKSMVILMVDLLDFPCSIWPDVVPLIGKNRKIFVVGNKVDLLPRDGKHYLERVQESLKKSLLVAGLTGYEGYHPTNVSLISAKTGYGVENLITRLYKAWNGQEDLYLIGCTNVGKSTLFNALLQSDLCATRENDLIQRATTSIWPGTTLNLLKFPIRKMEGWEKQLRLNRLAFETRVKAEEVLLRASLWKQEDNPTREHLLNRIGSTFRQEVPFTKESNHPFARKSMLPKPFDPETDKRFIDSRFVYDSPGAIYEDQILSLLTTEELLKTSITSMITPRTFSLQPFQTLFIAGLARVDVIHSRQNVLLTVFASEKLPIHVVYTDQANRFYSMFLGTELMMAPSGDTQRLNHWPPLVPKEIEFLHGDQVKNETSDEVAVSDQSLAGQVIPTLDTPFDWRHSCGDVVLSSAGWVSVTLGPDESCVLKAFTPEGRGIHVRKPSLLPFAVNMRGRRVVGTPCYECRPVSDADFEFTEEDRKGTSLWKRHQASRKEAKNVMRSFKIRNN